MRVLLAKGFIETIHPCYLQLVFLLFLYFYFKSAVGICEQILPWMLRIIGTLLEETISSMESEFIIERRW